MELFDIKAPSARVLDCTLRDGGYYNNWDFEPHTVAKYLDAMELSGVDFIEIGFRTPNDVGYIGPFGLSPDTYIEHLKAGRVPAIGVMINASDFLKKGMSTMTSLANAGFNSADNSPISFVRIASHIEEILECGSLIQGISDLGYKVVLNIMQADQLLARPDFGFTETVTGWIKSNKIHAVYYADSLGCMTPSDVKMLTKRFFDAFNVPIGVHFHDNFGLAFANALTAIETGASLVDATVLGMGRGAGNVRTESLLSYFEMVGPGREYSAAPLREIVELDFRSLSEKFRWGQSLPYIYAATHRIHPTYVQQLLENSRFNYQEIYSGLEKIGQSNNPWKYRRDPHEEKPRSNGFTPLERDFASGRDILIIGGGPSLTRHLDAVNLFIDRYKPVILSINKTNIRIEAGIDFHVVGNVSKADFSELPYFDQGGYLVCPNQIAEKVTGLLGSSIRLRTYELYVDESQPLKVDSEGCRIPANWSTLYACGMTAFGGPNRVWLAGVDGYDADDHRNVMINRTFNDLNNLKIDVRSITPTRLAVPTTSLYRKAYFNNDSK